MLRAGESEKCKVALKSENGQSTVVMNVRQDVFGI